MSDPNSNPSQCDKILGALVAAAGEWISMPVLCAISGSLNLHSRINELRQKRKVRILNKKLRDPADKRRILSFYRLPRADEA